MLIVGIKLKILENELKKGKYDLRMQKNDQKIKDLICKISFINQFVFI